MESISVDSLGMNNLFFYHKISSLNSQGPRVSPSLTLAITYCRSCREASSDLRSVTQVRRGIDREQTTPTTSSSRLERASATVLVRPDLYSTRKSNPKSLLIHCCCREVMMCCSNKNFILKLPVWTTKVLPQNYICQRRMALTNPINSFSWAGNYGVVVLMCGFRWPLGARSDEKQPQDPLPMRHIPR